MKHLLYKRQLRMEHNFRTYESCYFVKIKLGFKFGNFLHLQE